MIAHEMAPCTRQAEDLPSSATWRCLRSKPRKERFASQQLLDIAGVIDVFSPQVRIRRKTVRGPVWFVEALFPSYFFALTVPNLPTSTLSYSRGTTGIVHFGSSIATVPADVIRSLREIYGKQEFLEINPQAAPGDMAAVVEGPLSGMLAKVLSAPDAAGRVAILVEIMGQQVPVQLSTDSLSVQNCELVGHPLLKTQYSTV